MRKMAPRHDTNSTRWYKKKNRQNNNIFKKKPVGWGKKITPQGKHDYFHVRHTEKRHVGSIRKRGDGWLDGWMGGWIGRCYASIEDWFTHQRCSFDSVAGKSVSTSKVFGGTPFSIGGGGGGGRGERGGGSPPAPPPPAPLQNEPRSERILDGWFDKNCDRCWMVSWRRAPRIALKDPENGFFFSDTHFEGLIFLPLAEILSGNGSLDEDSWIIIRIVVVC